MDPKLPEETSAPKGGVERRRSQRIMLRVPVCIYGRSESDQTIYEETTTETVSAHGALLNVSQHYPLQTKLVLTNLSTEEDLACKVVFHGQSKEGQKQIAVEFLTPTTGFWHIHFPKPGEKPLKRFVPST